MSPILHCYRQRCKRKVSRADPAGNISEKPGCHYFLPGPPILSQPHGITAFRPVPNCTAWWQASTLYMVSIKNNPATFVDTFAVRANFFWSFAQLLNYKIQTLPPRFVEHYKKLCRFIVSTKTAFRGCIP